MASFEVRADPVKNRLYMTLEGMLDVDQANQVVEQVEREVARLDEGFDIVNDMSEFKPLSQEAADAIDKGKAIAARNGVNASVRVTGESIIGKMQFERHGDGDQKYHVATAETVEDAERLLERFNEDR